MNHSLDREFWLIILTTWEMWEVIALEDYAEEIEAGRGWSKAT
jgi:hypothetical protein